MNISVISFTENGIELSQKVEEVWKDERVFLYTKCSSYKGKENMVSVSYVDCSISDWAKKQMEEKNSLLFIGACGIAVRAIAPYVVNKLYDSPVMVMDEKGTYVIPILSGHMGGANEMARILAEKIVAIPVITTATDIQNKFAVDIFAKKNALLVLNKEGIAKVSSKVLAGKKITISIEPEYWEEKSCLPEEMQRVPYPPKSPVDIVVTTEKLEFQSEIVLQPREYVIGMGCKRGKETGKIETLICSTLEKLEILPTQVRALASVDIKKEEQGFILWSRKYGIPFVTYSADELQKVEGCFHESSFVKEKIGVDNVCERSALRYCEGKGELIYEKHAEDGMTIAIAKGKWSVVFDEK